MSSHFDNLLFYIPDLKERTILDLGAGTGWFLIESAKHGALAKGLEYNPEYIKEGQSSALSQGFNLDIKQGKAEAIPYPDGSFGFVNIAEVIEHIEDPDTMLREVKRVLKKGGKAYLSVPNRFGLKDQHFHLYFVNWLPRTLADSFIALFKRHKIYDGKAGRQRLSEMHYFTYSQIVRKINSNGLMAEDLRKLKLFRKYSYLAYILMPVYWLLRNFYFDSFHILISNGSGVE